MIQTDMLIVGAGPVGLFTVFEAGLLGIHCHLVDALPQPGGQLAEIYPKKPIYDIPGYASVLAGDLVDNLMEQIAPFHPGFTLGERAVKLEQQAENRFLVTTDLGTQIQTKVVVIAAGLGSFEPRKPPIENIQQFENNGVAYMIKEPENFRNKRLVIAGGGDSALDWTIYLAELASEITLVHRRTGFRGAPDSAAKVKELAAQGKIKLMTEAQVIGLEGKNEHLEGVYIKAKKEDHPLYCPADYFLPLFGLTPKMGAIQQWGLNIEHNSIVVDNVTYQTNRPGIYAVGDINTYPGKLKLILCGFHEATLMCQDAFNRIFPDKKRSFKYTTVNGVPGLEPQREEINAS